MAAMKPRLGVFTGITNEGRKVFAVRKPCDYSVTDRYTDPSDLLCGFNRRYPLTLTLTITRDSDGATIHTATLTYYKLYTLWLFDVPFGSVGSCGLYHAEFGCHSVGTGSWGRIEWVLQNLFFDDTTVTRAAMTGLEMTGDFSFTAPVNNPVPDPTAGCAKVNCHATISGTGYASVDDADYVQTSVCANAIEKQIFVKFTGDLSFIGGLYVDYNAGISVSGNFFWTWTGAIIDATLSYTVTSIAVEFVGGANQILVAVNGTGSASFPVGTSLATPSSCSPKVPATCTGVSASPFTTWTAIISGYSKAADPTGPDGEKGYDRLGLKVGPYSIHEGRKLFATVDCNPISPSGGGTPKLYRMGVFTGLVHKGRRLFAVENDQCCDGGPPPDADGPDPDPPSTPADQQMMVGCAFCAMVPKYIKILVKQAYPAGTFTFAPFWVVGTWDGYQYTVPSTTSPDGKLGFSVNYICGGAVPPFYSYCDPARPTYCNVWMANGSIFYNPISFGVVFACCTYDNQLTPTWSCDPFGFTSTLYGGLANCTASML